YYQYFSGYTF
nr:immunoglobulin light chain junction region [Macaca mulatta]